MKIVQIFIISLILFTILPFAHAKDFRDIAKQGNISEVLRKIRTGESVNPKSKYYNPLMHALNYKKERVAFILLKNGAKVNVKDNHNRTPLFYALENCSENMVLQILKKKPSLKNIFKRRKNSYLHIAVSKGYSQTVQMLLKRKVKVNLENYYHHTPLYLAVEKGNSKIVELLFKYGATIKLKQSKSNNDLLHLAARTGSFDIVKILVNKKIKINQKSRDNRTALEKAVYYKHDTIAAYLIKKGASVKLNNNYDKQANMLHIASYYGLIETVKLLVSKKISINKKNKYKSTPLDLALDNGHENVALYLLSKKGKYKKSKSLIHIAVKKDYKEILKRYRNKKNINQKDKRGNTQVHLAVLKGNVDYLKTLLNSGANINAVNKHGRTPLENAVFNNKTESVRVLLERGAIIKSSKFSLIANAIDYKYITIAELLINKTKQIDPPEKLKKSPLHIAIRNNYNDIARSIIKKIKNIDVTDSLSRTALHIACERSNVDIVKLLLKHGANINALDYSERTPLHYCRSKLEVVKLLLNKGTDVNAKDKSGKTVLSLSVRYENNEVAKYLIEKGADLTDDQGLLQLAADDNNYEMCSYLLKKGLDVNNNNYKYQMTPLHIALTNRRINYKLINLLIDNGADLNKNAKNKITPLFLALGKRIVKNQPNIINLLIEKGADINAQNKLGDTVLHYESMNGFKDIAVLIKNGAKIDAKNNKNETPLLVAVKKRRIDSVRELLKYKSNINAKNINGETALIIVVKKKYYSKRHDYNIAEILIKSGADIELKDNKGKTALDYARDNKRDKILKLFK
ncbi:MAG: hypothetical protein GY714_27250 [Desulfobacterales bacterium]|nr:hypothetical protein [Desulfobacterales bacterium]MCP4160751.1 hypothetical protein [Deltaproteobacteria bacterium]